MADALDAQFLAEMLSMRTVERPVYFNESSMGATPSSPLSSVSCSLPSRRHRRTSSGSVPRSPKTAVAPAPLKSHLSLIPRRRSCR